MPKSPLSTKRSGGPRTAAGKAKSAGNAIKHGTHALQLVSGQEQDALTAKVMELAAYYKPVSPLQHLQIKRIARCSVKLDALYAVEQAKGDLAQLEFDTHPIQYMVHFAHYPSDAQSLAAIRLADRDAKLPVGLTDSMLQEICQEIDDFVGVVQTQDELCRSFPKLLAYLKSTATKDGEGPFSMDQRLWEVASVVLTYVSLNLGDQLDTTSNKKGSEIDRLVIKYNREMNGEVGTRSAKRPPIQFSSYHSSIRDDLSAFMQLNRCVRQASEILLQYPRVQRLASAAAMIPAEDADRLMRYQTTLERQLSRSIGELLEINKLSPIL